jgi:hypothetical protein
MFGESHINKMGAGVLEGVGMVVFCDSMCESVTGNTD